MRSLILPVFLLLFLASCFHKNVMTDRADDVESSFIYSGKEGSFIITKEMIFQATSKESGGGVTNISGYSEYRITSYDLATGAQVGRVDLGEGIEKACIILGATPGKLWLYSIDGELGFHCRNPKTLDLISNEKTLAVNGPLKGFEFARPEWSKLDDLYGWNADNGLLMLSDMRGFHYYFDPGKNSLEKTEDEIPNYRWAVDYFGNSGYFAKDRYVSLPGRGRQKLTYRYEDSTGKLSYLDGELLLDRDPMHDALRKQQYADSLARELAAWNDSIRLLTEKYPELSQELRPDAHYKYDAYRMSWKLDDYRRKIEDLQRDQKDLARPHFKVIDNALLSDGSENFFIVHASDVSDTAKAVLTKIHLADRAFTEAWTLKLPDFYRDPGKADSKGAFETVFSEGDPRFGYQWVQLAGDKLVMISQLQMICVDAKSGKILWEHPL